MAIIKWDPFKDLDDFFSDSFAMPRAFREVGGVTVEQYDEDEKHIVKADMPGVKAEDIDISIQEGHLIIKAESHEKDERKGKRSYYSSEKRSNFYRVLPLPETVDEGKVESELEDGVLTVEFPTKKIEKPKVEKIEVKTKKK